MLYKLQMPLSQKRTDTHACDSYQEITFHVCWFTLIYRLLLFTTEQKQIKSVSFFMHEGKRRCIKNEFETCELKKCKLNVQRYRQCVFECSIQLFSEIQPNKKSCIHLKCMRKNKIISNIEMLCLLANIIEKLPIERQTCKNELNRCQNP